MAGVSGEIDVDGVSQISFTQRVLRVHTYMTFLSKTIADIKMFRCRELLTFDLFCVWIPSLYQILQLVTEINPQRLQQLICINIGK